MAARFIAILLLSLAVADARAVERFSDAPCLSRILFGLGLSPHHYGIDPAFYADAGSVLFLSDGLAPDAWQYDQVSLGEIVHSLFPEKKVVSADYQYRGGPGRGNYRRMSLDNNERFPMADNSFETVVLRRGLCVCHNRQCCGGFNPRSKEARSFFREVIRVMDKTKPRSRAVLHGDYGVDEALMRVWQEFLEPLEKEFGVRARIHSDSERFLLIEISPR